MSTPDMRATWSSFSLTPDPRTSALALLVARILADDDDPPVPADHFALLTHRLDAGSNLHVVVLVLYCSVSSPARSRTAGLARTAGPAWSARPPPPSSWAPTDAGPPIPRRRMLG